MEKKKMKVSPSSPSSSCTREMEKHRKPYKGVCWEFIQVKCLILCNPTSMVDTLSDHLEESVN